MKCFFHAACGFVAITSWGVSGIGFAQNSPATAVKEAPSLSSLKLELDVQRAELLKPQRELEESYAEQLNRLMNQVTEAGDLEKALTVKAELAGFRMGETKKAGDGFRELQRLQEIYAKASAKRVDTFREELSPVIEGYKERLVAVQTRLTQEKKLDEAVKAREMISDADEMLAALAISGSSGNRPLDSANREEAFENSLGMKFVPVPITGGPTGTRQLLFSIWETRVRDCESFVRRTKRDWPKAAFKQSKDHPAVQMSWDDARAFCQWLTEKERKEGVIEARARYRLPSDHEWSCAAGLGTEEDPDHSPLEKTGKIQDHFPWEKKWPPPEGAGNFYGEETLKDPVAGRKALPGFDDGYSRTSPVGAYRSNRFGLHDIGGNVWEWCEDWFDPATKKLRVLRGGSWINGDAPSLITSHRVRNSPATRNPNNGFRCVLEVDGN